MKKLICIALLFQSLAAKADTIQFAAAVQNEELAEEAITLLHCLSERSGVSWEFTGIAEGSHWLKLEESGKELRGMYHRGASETPIVLKIGEAESVCQKFYAETKAEIAPERFSPQLDLPALPANIESPKKEYWPWVLAFGAATVAGFFIWKSSQPDHRALQMN
ncbi:MAG: hypothetical protein AB7K68_13460 [Bacteriovoracia bacterium]